jgi:hypothetical protein
MNNVKPTPKTFPFFPPDVANVIVINDICNQNERHLSPAMRFCIIEPILADNREEKGFHRHPATRIAVHQPKSLVSIGHQGMNLNLPQPNKDKQD